MRDAVLLGPVFALVALTGIVWLAMLIARGRRMREKGIVPQDMPSRPLVAGKLGDAEAANYALMNLFEMPVLFYALMGLVLALGLGDAVFVAGGWLYVVLRAAQALIHITYNTVLHRGLAYLTSTSLLFLMWIRLAWMVFVG